MQVEDELAEIRPERGTVLTVGVFDGVHIGHKYLLSVLRKKARERNLQTGVITFKQHPLEVLFPEAAPPLIVDLPDKLSLLEAEGVDYVIDLIFTHELAKLNAQQFIGLLKQKLNMRELVIGPDFTLGRGKQGNVEVLRKLSREMNFDITALDLYVLNNEIVSSTAIRQALAAGQVEKAYSMTGRLFYLKGKVISGAGRGRGLGFPTANLRVPDNQALPSDGVYATRTHIDGLMVKSVTNIGFVPTFDNTRRTIETFLIDFRGDLYQKNIKVEFVRKLRDERKFNSSEELIAQINKDIVEASSSIAQPETRQTEVSNIL